MSNEIKKINQAQEILSAAFRCILRKGYANVSLRDIANEAGVVLSQLNYYYKNKEGLFTEVVKTLSNEYISDIESSLEKVNIKDMKKISLIEYFQEILRKKPEFLKLLFDLSSMALWSTSLKEIFNNLFKKLANLIDKYVVSNFANNEKLKEYSSESVSRMILGTVLGTSMQAVLSQDEDEKEDIESLSSLKLILK